MQPAPHVRDRQTEPRGEGDARGELEFRILLDI